MKRQILRLVAGLATAISMAGAAQASPVNYEITFTQTWLAHDSADPFYAWLGHRLLTGQLSIDDSVLGPTQANTTYGPGAPALAAIYSYSVTLDSKVYFYDPARTAAAGAPAFSVVVRTGPTGSIVDLQGALSLPGTISNVYLGQDTYEGTYIDLQQTDAFGNAAVSRRNYSVSPSPSVPVPEPESYALMQCGLAVVAFAARRRRA